MKKATKKQPVANLQVLEAINLFENKIQALFAKGSRISDAEDSELLSLLNKQDALWENYDWMDRAFEENGRWGVKDVLGKIIVPAKFDGYRELFHYKWRRSEVPMQLNGKVVLVKADGTGDVVPNTEYDDIRTNFFLPFFIMSKGKKFGFMEGDGTVFIDCICDKWYEPWNGITMYKSDGKFGLFDPCGRIVPPIYDNIEPDEHDVLVAQLGDKTGYLTEDCQFTEDEEEAFWTLNNFL